MSNANGSIVRKYFSVKTMWFHYETIAMHFNELLMKLRTQALAGVAAISTLLGFIAKTDTSFDKHASYVSGSGFLILLLLWSAMGFLDIFYYNRLLSGSVEAIINLEQISQTSDDCQSIDISTIVGKYAQASLCERTLNVKTPFPVWVFYGVVALAIAIGAFLSFVSYCTD